MAGISLPSRNGDEIKRETPVLHKRAVPCFFMNERSNITTERTSLSPEPAVMKPAPESDGNTVEAKMDNIVKWDFDILSGAGAQIRSPPQHGMVNFDGAQMGSSSPYGIGK